MFYNFYYDESEHSRKINESTINGTTYYDNFITAIVGWNQIYEKEIEESYLKFENKYSERKKKGELKSDTFKGNQFKYGFASFNKSNIELLDDFLSLINENVYMNFSIGSKIEYIVIQILKNYHNNIFVDMDAVKYSIVKSLVIYRPNDVLDSIYNKPDCIVETLIKFFEERIKIDQKNITLKSREIEAFENIILVLNDVEPISSIDWDYHTPFIGFNLFLDSCGIENYSLTIDKEGFEEKSKTLISAEEVGLKNVIENDSKNIVGLRVADMLAGIIGKMMKSINSALHKKDKNSIPEKNLLDEEWFIINDAQLRLYKKFYHVIYEINNDWYKVYAGNYSDDVVAFLAYISYMNHFKNIDEINDDLSMLPEYCNSYMCNMLEERFSRMHFKLPIEPIQTRSKEYFINNKGAKIYFDINKQPMLNINDGENQYHVLSVGISKENMPLVTILNNDKIICNRLPEQYFEWAMSVVGFATMGGNLFPSNVVFTKLHDKYYVDIL